MHYMIADEDG